MSLAIICSNPLFFREIAAQLSQPCHHVTTLETAQAHEATIIVADNDALNETACLQWLAQHNAPSLFIPEFGQHSANNSPVALHHTALPRPFSRAQLICAVAALTSQQRLQWPNFGHFTPATAILENNSGEQLTLTELEAALLYQIATSPQPLTREQLYRDIWGHQATLDTHTLETHLSRLRQKLKQLFAEQVDIRYEANGYSLALS